jgi:hypothetical protein
MAAALACSIGLHWGFLQPIAWTTMLVGNLCKSSLPVALQRTFDGKHPCALCKAIAEGKKAEKKSHALLPLKKFEGTSQDAAIVIPPPASFPPIEAANAVLETLPRTPPTPPPRAA